MTMLIHNRRLISWLYSINAADAAPEMWERLLKLQTESADVLYQYWFEGAVTMRPSAVFDELSALMQAHEALDWKPGAKGFVP